MNIESEIHDLPGVGKIIKLTPAGQIDPKNLPHLEKTVLDNYAHGMSRVILDLSNTKYLNSSGIGLLINLANRANVVGGGLRLINVAEKFRFLFDLLGLQTCLPILGTFEEAMKSFQEIKPNVEKAAGETSKVKKLEPPKKKLSPTIHSEMSERDTLPPEPVEKEGSPASSEILGQLSQDITFENLVWDDDGNGEPTEPTSEEAKAASTSHIPSQSLEDHPQAQGMVPPAQVNKVVLKKTIAKYSASSTQGTKEPAQEIPTDQAAQQPEIAPTMVPKVSEQAQSTAPETPPLAPVQQTQAEELPTSPSQEMPSAEQSTMLAEQSTMLTSEQAQEDLGISGIAPAIQPQPLPPKASTKTYVSAIPDPIPLKASPMREAKDVQLPYRIQLHAYQRMHIHKTYCWRIVLNKNEQPEPLQFTKPIWIVPLFPGCQVVPQKIMVAPNATKAVAEFWVTPYTHGCDQQQLIATAHAFVGTRTTELFHHQFKVTSPSHTSPYIALAFVLLALTIPNLTTIILPHLQTIGIVGAIFLLMLSILMPLLRRVKKAKPKDQDCLIHS